MSRAERLLNLVQLLRQHRRPVSAQLLAQELKVARRTLYRDIATLRAQGASIDGEPGVGYLLKPGFMLPPLMFSEDEIEAIVFGVRLAASRADRELGASAERALAKIASVLPVDLRESVYDVSLLVVPATSGPQEDPAILTMIREAIRGELKLSISYRDGEDRLSERVIWPFAVGFFDNARVLAAWCELRGNFRHFRTDRISGISVGTQRYPTRRKTLLGSFAGGGEILR